MATRTPDRPPRKAEETARQFLAALGRRVRAARARRGMTRKILARDSGVSERYLAQLEGGQGNPSVAVLLRIAAAMGGNLLDLLADAGGRPADLRLAVQRLEALEGERLAEARALLERRFPSSWTGGKAGRIALIGLRGAGKSTLGRRLAAARGVPFLELDRMVERDSGAEIGELLALGGQPAYRRHERRALEAAVSGNQAAVIAAGGGIVADGETYALLLESCHAIWLRARPDEHMARVVAQGDLRPMADNREAMADLEAILEARTPDYARADATLDTAGEAEDASFARLAALADRLAGGTVSPG